MQDKQMTSFLLFLLVMGISSTVWATQDSTCRFLFSKKKYLAAAECFITLSDSRDIKKQASKKGKELRNAAISYLLAAKKETNLETQAFLREKSISLLKRYVQKNLCGSKRLCTSAVNQQERIRKLIGYAQITIIFGNAKAKFLLQGYKYKLESKGDKVLKVRPGSYTFRYTPAGQKTEKVLSFKLKPKQTKVLNLLVSSNVAKKTNTPKKQDKKTVDLTPVSKPTAGMNTRDKALVYGGATAAGIGVGAIVLGIVFGLDGAEKHFMPGQGQDADDSFFLASVSFIGGGIFTAAGVGMLTTGLVLNKREKSTKLKKSLRSLRTNKQTFVSHVLLP